MKRKTLRKRVSKNYRKTRNKNISKPKNMRKTKNMSKRNTRINKNRKKHYSRKMKGGQLIPLTTIENKKYDLEMIEYQHDTDQGLVKLYEYDLPDKSLSNVYEIPYKITSRKDLVAIVANVLILRTIPKLHTLITEKIQEILLAAKERTEGPFKDYSSNYWGHIVLGDEVTDPETEQED